MTKRTGSSVVHLSGRDWFGLLAICSTVCLAVLGSYLRHDRMLTEVLTRQQATSERLEDVERSVERLEDRALRAKTGCGPGRVGRGWPDRLCSSRMQISRGGHPPCGSHDHAGPTKGTPARYMSIFMGPHSGSLHGTPT